MEYYNKVGLKALPQVFVNGFPLGENEIEADSFEESVITKIMQLTQEIQMAVYRGQLHDTSNLLDWLMTKDNIMPRLNPRVLFQERHYIDLNENNREFLSQVKYISSDKEYFHAITLWVVCDPDTEKGRQLLNDAIYFYDSSKEQVRVALVMQKSTSSADDTIKKAISYALDSSLNQKQSFSLIKRILKEKAFNELKSGKKTLSQLEFKDLGIEEDLEMRVNEYDLQNVLAQHRGFLESSSPFKTSESIGIIANGWVSLENFLFTKKN
jgi:UDP-glucose:glycoprotein glucosyltransferase